MSSPSHLGLYREGSRAVRRYEGEEIIGGRKMTGLDQWTYLESIFHKDAKWVYWKHPLAYPLDAGYEIVHMNDPTQARLHELLVTLKKDPHQVVKISIEMDTYRMMEEELASTLVVSMPGTIRGLSLIQKSGHPYKGYHLGKIFYDGGLPSIRELEISGFSTEMLLYFVHGIRVSGREFDRIILEGCDFGHDGGRVIMDVFGEYLRMGKLRELVITNPSDIRATMNVTEGCWEGLHQALASPECTLERFQMYGRGMHREMIPIKFPPTIRHIEILDRRFDRPSQRMLDRCTEMLIGLGRKRKFRGKKVGRKIGVPLETLSFGGHYDVHFMTDEFMDALTHIDMSELTHFEVGFPVPGLAGYLAREVMSRPNKMRDICIYDMDTPDMTRMLLAEHFFVEKMICYTPAMPFRHPFFRAIRGQTRLMNTRYPLWGEAPCIQAIASPWFQVVQAILSARYVRRLTPSAEESLVREVSWGDHIRQIAATLGWDVDKLYIGML